MAVERPTEPKTTTDAEHPTQWNSDDCSDGESDGDSSDDGTDEYIDRRLRSCPWTGESTTRGAHCSLHRNAVVVSAPRSLVGADEAARPKHQQQGVVGSQSAPLSEIKDEGLHEKFKETCKSMADGLKDHDFWNDNFDIDGISEETMRAIFGEVLPLEMESDDEVHVAPTQPSIKVALD